MNARRITLKPPDVAAQRRDVSVGSAAGDRSAAEARHLAWMKSWEEFERRSEMSKLESLCIWLYRVHSDDWDAADSLPGCSCQYDA